MNKPTRIFLIIGLTKESAHWDDSFVAKLKELFQTDNIVGIDLPGAGKFLQEKSPRSIKEIARVTRENYKELFNDNSYYNILVSISLGGMISTEWLSMYPNDFQEFVIVNSSFKNYSPLIKRLQPKAIKGFIDIFLTKNIEEKEAKVIKLTSNNRAKFDTVYSKWLQISKDRPMSPMNVVRQTYAGARFDSRYIPVIPTLIIAARHDQLAHYTCSVNLQKVWKKDFKLLEDKNIGHAVHLDASIELAEMIYEWSNANKQ